MLLRPAAGLVAAYLIATLPLVVLGAGGGAGSIAYVAGHGLALGAMVWGTRHVGRGWSRVVVDGLPLALIPFLYAELPQLMAGAGAGYHDPLVQRWESLAFGASPARTMAGLLPWTWLSEALHLAYFSYYALIFVPPLALYVAGKRREYQEMCFTVLLAFVACFTVFAVFPVQGPRYLWEPSVPDGPVRRIVVAVLEAGSSRGAAFPSSHVAVAVVQGVLSLRYGVPFAWTVPVATLGLALGAVYGGFHYAIDAVAGAAAGGLVLLVAPSLYRRVSMRAVPVAHDGQGEPAAAS